MNTISFIGAGNMAEALIKGLIASAYAPEHIIATARTAEKLHTFQQRYGIQTTSHNVEAVLKSDVVVLCVKPKNMSELLKEIKPALEQKKPLILSVASGITLARYEKETHAMLPFIRAMPNTPAAVGRAVTALIGNKNITEKNCETAEAIFRAVGKVFWLTEEDQINTVIALSGSGPAYLFLWMEIMEKVGTEMGLPQEAACEMTKQLFLGASKLAAESECSFETLRKQVTSPGGTTEQAIRVFEEKNIRKMIEEAMRAAADRGRELSDIPISTVP